MKKLLLIALFAIQGVAAQTFDLRCSVDQSCTPAYSAAKFALFANSETQEFTGGERTMEFLSNGYIIETTPGATTGPNPPAPGDLPSIIPARTIGRWANYLQFNGRSMGTYIEFNQNFLNVSISGENHLLLSDPPGEGIYNACTGCSDGHYISGDFSAVGDVAAIYN